VKLLVVVLLILKVDATCFMHTSSLMLQGYLRALGMPRTAQVKRDARIGEAEARRDAGIKVKHLIMQLVKSCSQCWYQSDNLIMQRFIISSLQHWYQDETRNIQSG